MFRCIIDPPLTPFFSYLAPLLSFDHSIANKYEQSSRLTTTQSKPRYAITKDGHRQFTCTSWFTMSDKNTFPTLSPTLPSPQFSLSFLPPPPHTFPSPSPSPLTAGSLCPRASCCLAHLAMLLCFKVMRSWRYWAINIKLRVYMHKS